MIGTRNFKDLGMNSNSQAWPSFRRAVILHHYHVRTTVLISSILVIITSPAKNHSSRWGNTTATTAICAFPFSSSRTQANDPRSYLTHDSMNARKAHNSGRNHVANVRDYFAGLGGNQAQSLIDQIIQQHESGGRNQMMMAPSMRLGAGFMNPLATQPGTFSIIVLL